MDNLKVVRHIKLISGEEVLCTISTSDNIMYIATKPVYVTLEDDTYIMSDMLPLSDVKVCGILGTSVSFMADASLKVIDQYQLMASALHSDVKNAKPDTVEEKDVNICYH